MRLIAFIIVAGHLLLGASGYCDERIQINRTGKDITLTIPDALMLGRTALSPDNRYIAFWDGGDSAAGLLGIYDLDHGRCILRQRFEELRRLNDRGELGDDELQKILWCTAFAFSPDSKLLAVVRQAYADPKQKPKQTLELRNLADGSVAKESELFSGESAVVVFSPDGNTLAVGAHQTFTEQAANAVYIWEAKSLQQTHVIPVPHRLNNLAFTQTGTELATVSEMLSSEVNGRRERWRELRQWEFATGKQVGTTQRFPDPWHANAFSFAPDGSLWLSLEIRSEVRTLRIWNVEGQRDAAAPIEPKEREQWDRLFHAISPSGKAAAIGYRDGTTKVVELPSGRILAELADHRKLVADVSFSHDGTRLITSSWDDTIKIRNVEEVLSQTN